jgi:hypothetical protein
MRGSRAEEAAGDEALVGADVAAWCMGAAL